MKKNRKFTLGQRCLYQKVSSDSDDLVGPKKIEITNKRSEYLLQNAFRIKHKSFDDNLKSDNDPKETWNAKPEKLQMTSQHKQRKKERKMRPSQQSLKLEQNSMRANLS